MKHLLMVALFCFLSFLNGGRRVYAFQSGLSVLETRYKEAYNKGQKKEAGKVAFLIATKYQNSGDVSSATDYYTKAINIFTEEKDAKRASESYQILGSMLADANKHLQAISHYKSALHIYRSIGDKANYMKVLLKLGKSYLVIKDYKKAVNAFQSTLKFANQLNDEETINQCYNFLSIAYEKYGRKDRALEYFKKYNESVVDEQAEHYTEIEAQIKKEKAELDKALLEKEDIIKDKEAAIKNIEEEKLQLERIKKEKELEVALLNKDKAIKEAQLKQKEADLKHDQLLINASIVGFIMLGGFIIFMIRAYRSKLVINKQLAAKNIEIEEQKKQLQVANKNITDSIRYAERIQMAMLADRDASISHIQDHFVLFRPKDIVSGDFYWFGGEDGEIVVAVVDCTGHGVPGAFMSLIGKSLLNEIVSQKKIHDPAVILGNLHIGVRVLLQQENKVNDDGMDVALCMIKASESFEQKLVYAGAKRPLYIVRDGEIEQVDGDRKSIGGRQKEKKRVFTNKESMVRKGDMLYLTSDGYADQNNPQNKKYGSPRLRNLMLEVANLPAKNQLGIFEKELDEHESGQPQRDDITIVGLMI